MKVTERPIKTEPKTEKILEIGFNELADCLADVSAQLCFSLSHYSRRINEIDMAVVVDTLATYNAVILRKLFPKTDDSTKEEEM